MRSSRSYLSLYLRYCASVFVLVGVAALCAPSANAIDEIWFSPSSAVPGNPGNLTVSFSSLGSKTMYVWLTSDVNDEITPPVLGYTDVVINGVVNHIPKSAASIAVNYAVTSGTSISLTGAQDINPVLIGSNPSNTRWDAASNFGPGNFNVTPASITQVAATVASIHLAPDGSVNSQPGIHLGLSSANVGTGGNPTDPNYVNGAWLLGSITFDVNAFGSAILTTQPSSLGIFRGGDGTGTASDPGNLTNKYTYDHMTITVPTPEPTSLVLIGLGGLAMFARRRRRSI